MQCTVYSTQILKKFNLNYSMAKKNSKQSKRGIPD